MGISAHAEGAGHAAGEAATRMVAELVRMHGVLQETRIPLETEGADAARAARREMVAQLEDYIIPRMMTVDAPLLTVVGGSTGAGKSTLVNSLVGDIVTTPGLLRPTTRSPVLVHHPDDAQWFEQDRLLPHLVRVDHATDDPRALQLVATERLKPGLAVLDAPDIDSVEEQNRLLAAELLAAGDLWLFVTSSARYADQVPWEYLKAAAERSASVAVVLDRTPVDAVQTVATHLARMLAARGLKDSPLFIVNEGPVSEAGALPDGHVAEIRNWLDVLADDAAARRAIVAQTLDGAVRALTFNVHKIADAAAEQDAAALVLREAAATAYATAGEALASSLSDGTLLHGDVAARWRAYADRPLTDLRERDVTEKQDQAGQLAAAVASAVELQVLKRADAAAATVCSAWAQTRAGAGILANGPADLGRGSRSLRPHAARAVLTWQEGVGRLVAGQSDYSVPGLYAIAQVATLGEGPARRLLTTTLGEQKSTDVVTQASFALESHLARLLGDELTRHVALLGGIGLDDTAPLRLRQAARRVDDMRWASQKVDAH